MSKSKSSLSSQLSSLLETPEENQKIVQGSPIPIIDLSLPYNHMFTPAAKRGISNKIKHLLNKREVKVSNLDNIKSVISKYASVGDVEPDTKLIVADRVHFFTVTAVGEEKIVKAARVVTNDINALAAKGYVTGCLQPLSCIKLYTQDFQLDGYAVFCYVSLTPEGSEWLSGQACGSHIQEGEAPKLRIT